jgi:hypothetical protein
VDGAAEDSVSSPDDTATDDPAAAALAAAGKRKPGRPKRASPDANGTSPAKPLLSEEQIRKLVLADSVKDLISLLDGR